MAALRRKKKKPAAKGPTLMKDGVATFTVSVPLPVLSRFVDRAMKNLSQPHVMNLMMNVMDEERFREAARAAKRAAKKKARRPDPSKVN